MKSTFMSMLGGFGDAGERESQKAPPREEKKPNPVELLKGLFGR